jgi:hypothetical protein
MTAYLFIPSRFSLPQYQFTTLPFLFQFPASLSVSLDGGIPFYPLQILFATVTLYLSLPITSGVGIPVYPLQILFATVPLPLPLVLYGLPLISTSPSASLSVSLDVGIPLYPLQILFATVQIYQFTFPFPVSYGFHQPLLSASKLAAVQDLPRYIPRSIYLYNRP